MVKYTIIYKCLNVWGPGAAADDDDDDLIIVEPHVNPLVEIEISEEGNSRQVIIMIIIVACKDEEVAESDAGSQSVAVVATDEQAARINDDNKLYVYIYIYKLKIF